MSSEMTNEYEASITHLQRRKIEGRVLIPFIEACRERFGEATTRDLVLTTIRRLASKEGEQWAEHHGGGLAGLQRVAEDVWVAGGGMDIDLIERTEDRLDFNVTRCGYAAFYQELGLADIGALVVQPRSRDGGRLRSQCRIGPDWYDHGRQTLLRLSLPQEAADIGRGRRARSRSGLAVDSVAALPEEEMGVLDEYLVDPKLSLLDKTRIQAQVLVPLLRALRSELGRGRADAIVKQALRGWSQQLFAAVGDGVDGSPRRKWAAMHTALAEMTEHDVAVEMRRHDKEALEFDITRCRFAEFFRALGEPELGALLICEADFDIAAVGGDQVRFTREQTIMQGAPRCTFRYKFAPDNHAG